MSPLNDQRAVAVRPGGGEVNHRRAEDVPGLDEPEPHASRDVDLLAVGHRHDLLERLLHVGVRVERLHPRLGVVAGDVEVRRVLFLDLGGVGEHHAQQVARRRRAVDRPVEPLADERRQVAAVVDVGVAEDDRVDLVRVKREVAVALPGFLAAALVQPAVEQDLVVADFEQVHRPGDAAGRPPEGEGRLGQLSGGDGLARPSSPHSNRLWQVG